VGSAGGDYFKVVGLNLLQSREFVAADGREIPHESFDMAFSPPEGLY
jgi:hypothetical protein